MKIGDKVKVLVPSEGKTHFGIIEDIVKDMFSKEPLYLLKVRLKEGVKTSVYTEASLVPMKQSSRKAKGLRMHQSE